MNSTDSSSDDECNIYVNAASKFYALNHQNSFVIEDDEEVSDESERLQNSSIVKEDTKVNKKENVEDDCIISLDEELEEVSVVNNDVDDDDDDAVFIDSDDTFLNTRSARHRRNSNKENRKKKSKDKEDLNCKRGADVVELNDSIEWELNQPYRDDSFLQQSQEESENFVLIGSPLPSKKHDHDNYEVSVKVLWRSNKMERFEIRKNDTFQKIFRYFANLEGVPEDQIFITKKDKRITPFDSPASIDWSILDILDGGVLSAEIAKKNKGHSENGAQENMCKIKIQTSDKRTLTILLKYNQTFATLVKSCSEQLDIPESKIKLYFDGELVDTDETPESLDIDDEACIDLKIPK